MKEAKDLLERVGKIVDIPKDLHPDTNPDHAVRLGQLGGVIEVYAQNGVIWDLKLKGGNKQQVHQQDLVIVICNMILEAHEETEELQTPKPEAPVEKEVEEESEPESEPEADEEATDEGEPGEVIEPSQGEIEPADGEMADVAAVEEE